jgi:amidase
MATFITRLENSTSGIRLAVKDLIDLAGVPTTAGSRALADTAAPADRKSVV